MYRPNQYDSDNTSINISTFGGINRRESISIGEFEKAKNLSCDEYPVLQPRQKYDRCLFNKFCLQWQNNNMFYALYPAIPYEDILNGAVKKFESETELRAWAGNSTTEAGIYRALVGNQAYETTVKVDGGTHSYTVPKTINSYILTQGFDSVTLENMPYFKDPVCTNIGAQTVINDKINGMLVINYNETADAGERLTYYKVAEKYVTQNETTAGSATSSPKITGGNLSHLRLYFENETPIKGMKMAVGNTGLEQIVSNDDYADYLIAYGETITDVGAAWFRAIDGEAVRVDNILYKYWYKSDKSLFNEGDYLYFGKHAAFNEDTIHGGALKNAFLGLDGWHEIVVAKAANGAGEVGYTAHPLSYSTMYSILVLYTSDIKQRENDPNEKILGLYWADGFAIERKAPENVDFMCTSANRVWCNNGQNEIMCCAQGNPNVWYRYEGNALDSYAVTIGGDGAFTGCIEYEYPLFFKNNKMYRITGTKPSNYQTSEFSMRGVRNGCHNSLAVVNDMLFYQSMDGIYRYTGSTPVCISLKIYRDGWKKGYACRYRDKYYLSVLETDGARHLYAYDTLTDTWHEENFKCGEVIALYEGNIRHKEEEVMTIVTRYDNPEESISGKVEIEDNTGWITQDIEVTTDETELQRRRFKYYAGYVISSDNVTKYSEEPPFVWEAVTGDLMAEYNEHKYIKRLFINAKLDKGASLAVYLESNQDGLWTKIASCTADELKTYRLFANTIPRCESFKIKLVGKGKAVIRNINAELEIGSDYS